MSITRVMGKVYSVLSRPLRNYNVGNRAQKQLAAEKPKAAPRHPSTVKYLQDAIDSPSSKEAVKVPQEYLDRLKNVYVKSEGKAAVDSDTETRKLPQSKEVVFDPEYGFLEPAIVPHGKVTMRQAIEILIRHQENPTQWTPQVLAKEYKLDVGMTQQMLLFFRAYDMWQPPQKTEAARKQEESLKKFIIPPKPLPQIK